MAIHHPQLLADIEAFIGAKEVSETTFGRLALRDPHFVRDLKNGRRLWPDTEKKIRVFMAGYVPAAVEARVA